MYLAHSEDKKKEIPPQSYAEHIYGVTYGAEIAANDAAVYAKINGDTLVCSVKDAAEYHDLGKLDAENQKVLSGIVKARHLPVQHTEAGTSYLLQKDDSIKYTISIEKIA